MKKILPAILFFLPFSFALNPTDNIDLSVIRLVPFLLFFLWLAHGKKTGQFLLDRRPIFWLWLIFLSLIFASFLWAEKPSWSLRKSFFLISFLPFYLFSFSFFNKKNPLSLFKAFFYGACLLSLFGLLQFFSSLFWGIDPALKFWNNFQAFFLGQNFSQAVLDYPSFLVNISGKTFLRAFGSLPDPHLFGAYLALSLPFGWWLYEQTKKRFWLGGMLLVLLASLFSFSRTVYLMLLVQAFLGIFLFLKNKTQLKVFLILFSIFFPLFLTTNNPLKERFFSSFNLQEGSVVGRIAMWEKAKEAFEKNPLGGLGLGNFPLFVEPNANLRQPISAHNLFLDFLAETGLLSFVLLLFIFGLPLLNNLFSSQKTAHCLALFFFGFLIYSFFENPFFSLQLFPLFLIFLAL